MTITFGSVCSGIEAASEAFAPLGFTCAFVAETDEQASAVLAHHYGSNFPSKPPPANGVPNLGDLAEIDGTRWAIIDLLIGGTPCQSFSLAGKRQSLDDARGNLALTYVRLAHAIDDVRRRDGKPGLVVAWENVPGVLSTPDNAFGCLLAGFVGCDVPCISPLERGRWPDAGMVEGPRARLAWRVLDAQYFGLAQRRERVLVVISFRDGPDPAAILFEPGGVRWNPPTRRKAGEDIAGTLGGSSQSGGFRTTDLDNQGAFIAERVGVPDIAWALQERDAKGTDSSTKDGHLLVEQVPIGFSSKDHGQDALEDLAPTMRAMNFDQSHINGGGQLAVAFKPSHYTRGKDGAPSEVHPPLSADADADKGDQEPIIFQSRIARNGRGQPSDVVPALNGSDAGATSDMRPLVATRHAVRRLMPHECERLQGFRDNHTLVPWKGKMASDSARYRQLGNSMPVPMIRWLGRRIQKAIEESRQ